ncbi:triose-phosphate isomerase, partial [Candidatus Daviesbacteria bacterium]|nr:triose-phosphate isomerase [Candidatus Daviesbacteria bacterium]
IPLVCVQDTKVPVPPSAKLVVYEPIFAIGSGNPDTPDNADSVAQTLLQKNPNLEVLYGGSVTEENAKAFLQQDNISGLLIGGTSLDPEKFLKIVELSYNI